MRWWRTPTVKELVKKALKAGIIDPETANEMRERDLQDAIGYFYEYMLENDPDAHPELLLKEWGIVE